MLKIRTAPTQLVATGSGGRTLARFLIVFLLMWYWVIFQMWNDGERWAVFFFVLASGFPILLLGVPSRDTLVLDVAHGSVTMRRRNLYRKSEERFEMIKLRDVSNEIQRRKPGKGTDYAILLMRFKDKSRQFGPPLDPATAQEHVEQINTWLDSNRPPS